MALLHWPVGNPLSHLCICWVVILQIMSKYSLGFVKWPMTLAKLRNISTTNMGHHQTSQQCEFPSTPTGFANPKHNHTLEVTKYSEATIAIPCVVPLASRIETIVLKQVSGQNVCFPPHPVLTPSVGPGCIPHGGYQ